MALKLYGPYIRLFILSAVVLVCALLSWRCLDPAKEILSVRQSPVSYLEGRVEYSWATDISCFIQGMTFVDAAHLLVSCGGYGTSQIMLVSGWQSSGAALQHTTLYKSPTSEFLEGITCIDGSVYVLTWRNKKILEFSLSDRMDTLTLTQTHPYGRDGWGLTHDSVTGDLFATDGSSKILTLSRTPDERIETIGACDVLLSHDGITGIPVSYINELEYHNGTIWANIFISNLHGGVPNYLLGISATDCSVRSVVPLFGLADRRLKDPNHVMNGIAIVPGQWSETGERKDEHPDLLVFGKMWKRFHQIRLGGIVNETGFDPLWRRYNITGFITEKIDFSR